MKDSLSSRENGSPVTPSERGRRASSRRSGMALIWVAVTLVVLVGMVGLAIDTAYILYVAHQLQNAADASALAAAAKVNSSVDEAHTQGIYIAGQNVAAGESVLLEPNPHNTPIGDIVFGRFDRETQTFKPSLDSINAVKVIARRTKKSLGGPLPLLFGPAFGVQTANVSRSAIAMLGGGTGGGLIALNETEECSFYLHGDVNFSVNDGDIQVNSEDSCGSCAQGSAVVEAPNIRVKGEMCLGGNVEYDGFLYEHAPRIQDPLAYLPEPTWDPSDDRGRFNVSGGTHTVSPGYYSGGFSITGGDITLEPGIYILDGTGLNISGNTNFTAEGVMFYITGTGYVDLTGSGNIRITPPDPDEHSFEGAGTYEYISIFQARDNTNEARIIGTSLMDLSGTLYFSGNDVALGGTGDGFGNQLIADTIEIAGTGDITIMYEGSFPAPGNEVFIVQ